MTRHEGLSGAPKIGATTRRSMQNGSGTVQLVQFVFVKVLLVAATQDDSDDLGEPEEV